MIGHPNPRCKREINTVGVDPSLRGTGVCFLVNGTLIPYFLPEKKLRGVERLVRLRQRFEECLSAFPKLQLAVIENYAYDALNRLAEMAEWGGLIKVTLYERGIPFVTATPQQLKRFATNNGSAGKEKVMRWVEKKWGLDVAGNDNLSDAAVLAKIGEVYLTQKSIYRSELEVVKAMKEPKSNGKKFRKPRGIL